MEPAVTSSPNEPARSPWRNTRFVSWLRAPVLKWGKTFALSATVGLLAGLAAAALEFCLAFGIEHVIGRFTHVSGPGVFNFKWGVLLLPAIGGLFVGILFSILRPKDHSHGTNQLIRAFHQDGGNLPFADPALKASAAVGIIWFGGSAGPEGPIAALGAAIGSSLSRILSLSPRTRRTLLIAGCGGGVGAIFRTPLGGALFATSILYKEPEFEADAIVPAFIASIVSYSTFMSFLGFGHPLIRGASTLVFSSALELIPYAILGPLCALLAGLLFASFRFVERIASRVAIPRWFVPALGGLLVGALGCALPQIMDARYQFIQNAADGTLFTSSGFHRSWVVWAALFGAVALLKCIASGLTVGSSNAGGLLGPSVFIGGVCGAFVGALCEAVYPGLFPEQLRRALIPVGMAGVLSAAMCTPLAAIVMVTEMTGSYGLIVPLMLVSITSYVAGRRWGLNSQQLRSSDESPAHAGDALVRLLESYHVRDFVKQDWLRVVTPTTSLATIVSNLPSGGRPIYAVVENGALLGLVTLPELTRLNSNPGLADIIIAADLMKPAAIVLSPEQRLYDVLDNFASTPEDALPVVSTDATEPQFMGMLPRQALQEVLTSHVDTMRHHLHREHAGVKALQQDEQLRQLLIGISPQRAEIIQRMHVPADAIGKSLRESDFRRTHHAQVIAIQCPDGTLQAPPDVDIPLMDSHLLLVITGETPEASYSPEPSAITHK